MSERLRRELEKLEKAYQRLDEEHLEHLRRAPYEARSFLELERKIANLPGPDRQRARALWRRWEREKQALEKKLVALGIKLNSLRKRLGLDPYASPLRPE